jgi:hypothetical protein
MARLSVSWSYCRIAFVLISIFFQLNCYGQRQLTGEEVDGSATTQVVTITVKKQYVYEDAPTVRIKGTGFEDQDVSNIILDLSVSGLSMDQSSGLEPSVDYIVSKNSKGYLSLQLLDGKR